MSANIQNLDAIREFRARLMKFSEELDSALQAMRMETHRSIEWIEQDRPRYWTNEMRKAFDLVAATRTALTTCQMRTVAGRHPSCIEEKVAHAKAKQRLELTQMQVERVKRWSQKLRHEVDEFRGRVAGLQRLLDTDIPDSVALLGRTITVIEDYAEINRPSVEPESGGG